MSKFILLINQVVQS